MAVWKPQAVIYKPLFGPWLAKQSLYFTTPTHFAVRRHHSLSKTTAYFTNSTESNDANHWCFIMTLNKRCPLWHENTQKTCPGGATAVPIFGRTSVYLKKIAGLSHEGRNETTIEYKLIHRYQGFFGGTCTGKYGMVKCSSESTTRYFERALAITVVLSFVFVSG